ncbi:MAG: ribonucleoside triphosphate reductase [Sedimentisphaerales bacterium]|nr:ribonucleoside triphosphate reductase [Sedimentisphaerales bacterium]
MKAIIQKNNEKTDFTQLHSSSYKYTHVIKRNGQKVVFNASKIQSAILKAGEVTGEFDKSISWQLTIRVLSLAQITLHTQTPEVEQIQDLVEDVLLTSPYKKTAKAYILYRDQHAQLRKLLEKADVDLVDNYLGRLDWKVQENSNMSYSLQGLNNYISSEISTTYWLNKIYPSEIRQAHMSGDFHIHDLGSLSIYCVGWDLQDVLRYGFKGVSGKIESKPAKHFRTALGQIVNFFYTLQGEAAGAQAFSNIDTLLAPFIRYDNLSYNEVRQCLQEFVFNVNVPTRVGFQTPFTNITLDLQPPSTLTNTPVVISGQTQPETYGDFQEEMLMFNRAFLEVMAQGDAKGRVFTFPIPTYNMTTDFDWDSPEFNLLWEVTAKYGIPNFANFVNSDMSPDDARSMCCRLRLDLRHLEKRGGGLFGANPLTGSIGVVTINMPRLGHISKNENDFLDRLDKLMEMARLSLETKRKLLEIFTEKNLYPYTKYYLRIVKERFNQYWHNHFSTIGLCGMNEACLNLLGKDIGTTEGSDFAKRVLDYMRETLLKYQEDTGNLYNLEATPAEGTSYRLAKLDKEKYPDTPYIKHRPATADAKPYYSNSTQLPVNYTNDIWQVLELQDELQSKYTGGTSLHIYLGESNADPQALKCFIQKVCKNYHLPYFTISPIFSICPEHGYLRGNQSTCPECGTKTEVYARVVGYLRPIDQWNEGKQSEFNDRTFYKLETVL